MTENTNNYKFEEGELCKININSKCRCFVLDRPTIQQGCEIVGDDADEINLHSFLSDKEFLVPARLEHTDIPNAKSILQSLSSSEDFIGVVHHGKKAGLFLLKPHF